jgi:hypothetical protein
VDLPDRHGLMLAWILAKKAAVTRGSTAGILSDNNVGMGKLPKDLVWLITKYLLFSELSQAQINAANERSQAQIRALRLLPLAL